MRPPALSSGHFASSVTSAAASGSTFSRLSSADLFGQGFDEIGPLVGGHLRDDRRGSLDAELLDQRLLLILVETLEDGRGLFGLERPQDERRLLLVEHPDEVGEILVVDLLEQRADLRRIFGE
jgi:hypothetical protein